MYDVILADPPWLYTNYGTTPGITHSRARGAAKYYPTMPTPTIAAMPIAAIAAKPAALFMWATWPTLPDAIAVIEAWGFKYKTIAWVWVKLNPRGPGLYMGMGSYTRGNTEPCLLAFRGKPIPPAVRTIGSVIVAPVARHSAKPAEQYTRIEALYPEARRLELFARATRPGWDAFGNQIADGHGVDLDQLAAGSRRRVNGRRGINE